MPREVDADELFDSGISSGINFDRFDNIQAEISGEKAPQKINTFEEANLRYRLEIKI